jgi:predicted aspartyl protease
VTLQIGNRLSPHAHFYFVCAASLLAVSVAIKPVAASSSGISPDSTGAETKLTVADNSAIKEPVVDDVINSALTAYGGKSELAQVAQHSTLYGEQKSISEPGSARSFRMSFKGDKWRLDLNDSAPAMGDSGAESSGKANRVTVGFDGRHVWQITDKTISAGSSEDTQNYKLKAICQPFLLSHWQDPGYRFTLLGRTTYKQAQVFAVEVQCANVPGTFTIFIDQQNYLVVAMQSNAGIASGIDGRSKPSLLSYEFTQYRPVGGTLWPFKQVLSVDSAETTETDLKSVDLSTEVADSAFFAPSTNSVAHLSKEIVVPFDYAQHEIVLKGRFVTGEEMEFLLDTGASDTLIDRRVAAEHFLPKDGTFNIAAMSGMVAAENSVVKRLEIGKLIINDIPVKIIDLSGQSKHLGRQVSGIIGMNVIGRYLVTLDYSKPAMTFADADDGARPNVKPVAFVKNEAPYVSVGLNNKESCNFLVDTGAAFNHMPESFAKHYITGDASGKHFIEGTGLDGQPVRLGTVVLDSVILGGFAARKISFTYPARGDSSAQSGSSSSSSVAQKTGFFQDSSCGILGNPFWQNFVVTLDWKYQRLFLRNNPGFNARDVIQKSLAAGDAALTLHREYRDAEFNYQKALMVAESSNDQKERARLLGRLGNLRRLMAKDLKRPEHAKASYDYFTKAEDIAQKGKASDVEGRILADWSLLYADNGQQQEARTTMERGLALAPDDPNVNVDVAVQLYRSGLFPEMQKYVEKALFLDPDNWQALWYQVKLSENFNDTPRVVATLKDIVRYYPWSKVAKDKLAALLTKTTAPAAGTQGTPGGASSAAGSTGGAGGNSSSGSPGLSGAANQPRQSTPVTTGTPGASGTSGLPARSTPGSLRYGIRALP